MTCENCRTSRMEIGTILSISYELCMFYVYVLWPLYMSSVARRGDAA